MLTGNFLKASGVILFRDLSGEKNLWLKLFLKEFGVVNVTAKKSGSDSEPFLWGKFGIKKKKNSLNYLIDEFEIADDMFFLRKRKEALMTALKWSKMISKRLPQDQADDELLANLYWSMKLLENEKIPAEVSDWKFLWRWLESWGLAPELADFYAQNNFNHDEIVLLTQISLLNTDGVIDFFSKGLSPKIRKNSFNVASELAEKFLTEK